MCQEAPKQKPTNGACPWTGRGPQAGPLTVSRDLPTRQAMLLLRAGFRVLSTLCLKRCRCVELLLDARLNSQPLLGLSDLRGTACRSRDRSLAEAAGGER